MVKKILKIVAIVLAGFIVIAGAAVGISALAGRFNEEVINITKLYFDEDSTKTVMQVKTLEDVVANINFEPKNATNRELKVEVLGNENGIIKNMPTDPSKTTTLTAGEDFNLQINKDDKGNNIGGVVTIKLSQGIATAELKVVVDVDIPDNSLYFSGDNSGKITTTGKQFTMARSNQQQYVYLNSNLVNAFYLPSGTENLKSVQIGYDYYVEGKAEPLSKSFTKEELVVDRVYNKVDNVYNYFYKIPVVTEESGVVDIWAKMHRTSEIEEAYKANGTDELVQIIKSNTVNANHERVSILLAKYNDFLNKYVQYFDNSEESYQFFKSRVNYSTSQITLTEKQVLESLDYVFVTCHATINVTAIKLDDFTSIASAPVKYNVFDDKLYSISGNYAEKIGEKFELSIKTDNDDASGVEQEKEYMLKGLSVKPYLYLNVNAIKDEIDEDHQTLKWQGRTYNYLPVYYFDKVDEVQKPVTTPSEDMVDIIGYLLRLENDDEYLSIKQLTQYNEKHWRISCNVPLPENMSSNIYKALYIGFEVSGIRSDSGVVEPIQTFVRVNIEKVDYDFVSQDVSKLAVNDLDPIMSVNDSDLIFGDSVDNNSQNENASSLKDYQLTSGMNKQNISVNINEKDKNGNHIYISDPTNVTYKNVMYFVESNSNKVDGESAGGALKVATVGKYKFITMTNANTLDSGDTSNSLATNEKFGDEDLVGERIPTYTVTTDSLGNETKNYYLLSLNASTKPVKIFAVVYLSDKNGNPIDVNGRPLNIDESGNTADIVTLVVTEISNITDGQMPEVIVESYVDNMYFYTDNKVSKTFGEGENALTFEAEQLLLRNSRNYHEIEDTDNIWASIDDFLKLKLLKDNYFTLYMSNMVLKEPGVVNEDYYQTSVKEVEVNNAYIFDTELKVYKQTSMTMGYSINSYNNKQLAFNKLCNAFDGYNLYIGGSKVSVESAQIMSGSDVWVPGDYDDSTGEWVENSPAVMVKWTINSTADEETTGDPYIWLDAKNSSIPYSSKLALNHTDNDISQGEQEQYNNYVTFNTYKLSVEDFVVDESVVMQNNITARYADLTIAGAGYEIGDLVFQYETGPSSVGDYSLTLQSDGNIKYTVNTNLIIKDNNNPEQETYNLNYVDCSQAVLGSDTGVYVDSGDNASDLHYESLYEYINYYVRNSMNTKISYRSTEDTSGMITLTSDGVFTSEFNGASLGDNIVFGTNIYKVVTDEITSEKIVNINGYKLPVSEDNGKYTLTIPRGSYFPMVGGSYALIYNELFTINQENGRYTIESYYYDSLRGVKIGVSKDCGLELSNNTFVSYNSGNYLSDDGQDNNSSAIKIIGTAGDEDELLKASLNFIQGEEVKGTFVLVGEDDLEESKDYYKKLNNSYVLIGKSENYSGNRYELVETEDGESVGVKVYLLISFDTSVFEGAGSVVYKAIEYVVLQQQIKMVVKNSDGGNEVINSVGNQLELDAGTVSTISYGGTGAHIEIDANMETYFAQHISYEIIGTSNTEIKCEKKNDGSVDIELPDMVEDESFTLRITYPYKGTQTKDVYIVAKANIDFDSNILNTTTGMYEISLTPGSHDFGDIFNTTNFVYTGDITGFKLVGNNVDNVNKTISVKDAYVYYNADDKSIVRPYELYNIVIIYKEKEITLPKQLKVITDSEYIVDISGLEDSDITIFDGDNIFGKGNYIGLYNKDINVADAKKENWLANTGSIYSVFTLEEKDTSLLDTTLLAQGVVQLKVPTITDQEVVLKVSYPGLATAYEFNVTIRGVVLDYSSTGNVASVAQTLSSNIEVTLNSGDDFEFDKYFSFKLYTSDENYYVEAVLQEQGSDTVHLEKIDDITEEKTYYIVYYIYDKNIPGEEIKSVDTGFDITIKVEASQPTE